MRRALVLLLAAGAAVAVAAPANADPLCDFTIHAPDVHVDPDGPYYVTVTPRQPQYVC